MNKDKTKWPIRVIVCLYLITWIFGVPATQSKNDAFVVSEYKQLKAEGDPRVWDMHPTMKTYAAMPVLPFVVVSYQEFVVSGLNGAGIVDINLWYLTGVRLIIAVPVWMS